MYKSIVLGITLLMLSGAAVAERSDSPYLGTYVHRLEYLTKQLSLRPEQKAKLDRIFKEQSEKFRAINEQAHKQMREVLNADQIEKWEDINRKRQERIFKRRNAE